MNFKSATEGFLKLGRRIPPEMSVPQIDKKEKATRFSLGLYGLVTSLLLGSVAGFNWLMDPLWYSRGNSLTGENYAFNERITKTNVFLRTKDQENYNCIVLGSSMVSLVGDDFDIGGKRLMAPRLTLLSGVTAEVRTERLHMKFRAKIEGQKVVVTAIVGGKATSWVIPDGRTGLADMTSAIGKTLENADGKRYYLKVKADLITPVEEAEQISAPQASIPQMTVTPNVIIQEEEEELVIGSLVNQPAGADKSDPQPAGEKGE